MVANVNLCCLFSAGVSVQLNEDDETPCDIKHVVVTSEVARNESFRRSDSTAWDSSSVWAASVNPKYQGAHPGPTFRVLLVIVQTVLMDTLLMLEFQWYNSDGHKQRKQHHIESVVYL